MTRLVLTSEHHSKDIPSRWRGAFAGGGEILRSHRGWDIGVPSVFRALKPLADATFQGRYSRLLIDLNRSETHPHCFSEFSKRLPKEERNELVVAIHRPFRNEVEGVIRSMTATGDRVLHLSVHTFTPILHGQKRNADIGLLYDPGRANEKEMAQKWHLSLTGKFKVRRNYPYRGTADGHVTALRRKFPNDSYMGIELEINQLVAEKGAIGHLLQETLKDLIYSSNSRKTDKTD